MSVNSLNEFLARARSALAVPTLYWLGHGGWVDNEAATLQPGRAIDIVQALARKRIDDPSVAAQYEAAIAHNGLKLADLPRVACDCSGFVAWALGLPRTPAPLLNNGWINTDSMHQDATHGQTMFKRLERALPGALLVYPKPGSSHPGHVAIVSAVDAQGRATQMIHCAAENYLIEAAAGAVRNAIAETGTEVFDANPATVLALYQPFAR